MSELATLSLARSSDAREIAEMSRDLIEQGLSWSWTPARVERSIAGRESSVVVARRDGARRDGPRGEGAWFDDLRRGGAARGIWRDGGIAAFAIMQFGDEVAHLNLLAVAPPHRRQGLGRQLMEWLAATAVEAGVFRVNLEVRADNVAAREFYRRIGFDALNVVQGYYQGREAALRMTRRLP